MTPLDDSVEELTLAFRDRSAALAKARGDLGALLSGEKRLDSEEEKLAAAGKRETLESDVEEMRTSLESLRVRLAAARAQAGARATTG